METKWFGKHLLFLLISLVLPALLVAQEATFEAYADAKQAVLNSYFEVTFTLKNGDGNNFRAPSFDNFNVLSGPARSVSTTIINGVVSKELSYSFTLQPKRLGHFTIGSASIRVGNRELQTKPLTVEVVEGKSSDSTEGEGEVFVRAEPNTQEAWIGQQVIVSYRLYTTVNIDNYNVLQESEYAGFYAEDIRRMDSRVKREVIDGKQYATKLLRQVALYPQQTGALTIDPMQIQMGVVTEDAGRRNNFFFNRQIKRIAVQTEPIIIQVRPLPENAPPSFTGAVGEYQATASLSQNTVTTDDVLQLTISISGDGDIKRVQPPAIPFPESFERYDPKIIDESRYENGERIIGKKVIEYLTLPKEAGVYEIRPAFTYFDPDSARYITFGTTLFRVQVEQGSARPQSALPPTETAETSPQEIKYIKMETAIHRTDRRFFGSSLFWVCAAFPFLLLTGAVVYKRYLVQKAGADPLLLRTKRARKVALKRLQTAENHLKAKDSRAFYDEISKAMLGYVCDKLQIPRSELTKDNVRSKLQTLQVAEGLTADFMQIIHNTEIALFAGMDNAASMEDTYHKALDVLTNVDAAML